MATPTITSISLVSTLFAGSLTRISNAPDGTRGNSSSYSASFSTDSTKIVFASEATNLAAADTQSQYRNDIFVKNLLNGSLVPVSTTADGSTVAFGYSRYPAFSPDGNQIVFWSDAAYLVPGDTNNRSDIFVKDLATGAISRVSTAADGSEGTSSSSDFGAYYFAPAFSPLGGKVVFASNASNLVAGDTNNAYDIFVKDLATGAILRVSTASDGTQTPSGTLNAGPVFSPDGSKIAFFSDAYNLAPGVTGSYQIYVKDLTTGATSRWSTAADGSTANSASTLPVFSLDGSKLAFRSAASNLVPGDTNGVWDIFVKDLATGAVTRVSTASDGTQSNGDSDFASFLPDGRLAFTSYASNLVSGDTNGYNDTFLKDLTTGQTIRLSTTADGAQADGGSIGGFPQFSADGRRFIFVSAASNLILENGTSGSQVYVKDLITGTDIKLTVSDAQTVVFDAGDGTAAETYPATEMNSIEVQHLYQSDGQFTATLTAKATGQPDATQTLVVTIANRGGAFTGDGGSAADLMLLSGQADNAHGDAGDDFLIGGAGDDTLDGGPGNDFIQGGTGADTLIGGAGLDTADYAFSPGAVSINLATGHHFGGDAQGDFLSDVENVIGSLYDDMLAGDGSPNVLNGGPGLDTVDYYDSPSAVSLNLATNVNSGGSAQGDTLIEIERVVGTAGDDTIVGSDGIETVAFSDARSLYNVHSWAEGGIVKTLVEQRSGLQTLSADTLSDIENLQFLDHTFRIAGAQLNKHANADGDQDDDVFFQNTTTGQVYGRVMDLGEYRGWTVVSQQPSDWTVVGSGDVNPIPTDSRVEIFSQQQSTGTIAFSGSGASGYVSQLLTPDWKLRSVSDVNGDASVDAIIQNEGSGTIYYADMQGGAFHGWGVVSANVTGEWHVVGARDINRDGFSDVVVQQASTGTTYYANMTHGTFSGWGVVAANVNASWQVRAVADLTGDGFADVIFQNTLGAAGVFPGTTYYADMAQGTFDHWGVVTSSVTANWVVQGTADMLNDGYNDVLFQNATNGTTYFAEMGPSGFRNWGVVASDITADWHVV